MGGEPQFGGQMLKANKKEQHKQVLTSWLRGPETLNKLAKGGGGGGRMGMSPCPSPVASTAAIHSLLQS